MKNKLLAASGLLALGVVSQVSAQIVPVYISGSTAFRNETVSGIEAVFDGGAPTNVVTRGNTDEHSAQYSILEGNVSGVPYHVFCLWSGAEAGLAALSSTIINDVDFLGNPITLINQKAFFLKDDLSTVSGRSASAPGSSETNTTFTVPDLAMADTSKAITKSAGAPMKDYGFVAVVPFTWVKGTNSDGTFTAWNNLQNVTHSQLKNILSLPQKAGLVTGNSADDTHYVYAVGRNIGSGTRDNELADLGYGVNNAVDQYVVNANLTKGTFDSTLSGFTLTEIGNAGYDSGGDVSKSLSVDGCSTATGVFSETGVICIGFLGIPDATANKLSVANNWLTLNGVLETDGAVAYGQYSAWGHEHLYGKNGISGNQDAFGTALAPKIPLTLPAFSAGGHSKGIRTTDMHAVKGSDLAYPTRS